ncbi:MAG: phasin family protein [Eubacteriales bacterium]|jgi:polyhydroxyalkanoate synthesis regulator phasin
MKELIQKAIALGWGAIALTREAAEKLVDELVEKGEVGREEAKDMVNDMVERGKKGREEIQKVFRQEIAKVLDGLNLPSQNDLSRLEEKIDRLLQRDGKE